MTFILALVACSTVICWESQAPHMRLADQVGQHALEVIEIHGLESWYNCAVLAIVDVTKYSIVNVER